MIERVISCREGRRCGNHFACPSCAESWRKKKFLKHFNNFKLSFDSLTYIVVKNQSVGSLKAKLEPILKFLDELRLLKKRDKLQVCFCRLEVSFSRFYCGFNPHLNIILLDENIDNFAALAAKYNLSFWHRKKSADINTLKSIGWYILKFNNIGIERGEAVRKALNRKNTILYTKEFEAKDYIDEIANIDFSFLGVYPIRTKKEIELRKKRAAIVKEINQLIKKEREKFMKGV